MGDFQMEVYPENVTPRFKEKAIQDLKNVHKGEVNSYSWEIDGKITLFSGEFMRQCVVIIKE